MVAHERLTEPRVIMKGLLAKPRSFSNLPVFLNLNGIIITKYIIADKDELLIASRSLFCFMIDFLLNLPQFSFQFH